jgi:hypothetical protein
MIFRNSFCIFQGKKAYHFNMPGKHPELSYPEFSYRSDVLLRQGPDEEEDEEEEDDDKDDDDDDETDDDEEEGDGYSARPRLVLEG